ncbi:ice-structuring glycoprotein-like isoform X1 [Brachypodium distachyon]|uniref:Uncharacterized protein n=1 Tax=Brachypodium distachyon TaxID=15368 RepID=A0A2K2D8N6_BRADI|nr:ice-structuring glycoprotein-like isoform X1 [Brachypodium distachyon]PNT70641.1 hypothetical protein BRADI_2g14956v3 [Brachypodium distachyon]|eukprot:XP_024314220.1 ice-structuring glycoprotein-like isoform X1 [Brachypodium distachyon]
MLRLFLLAALLLLLAGRMKPASAPVNHLATSAAAAAASDAGAAAAAVPVSFVARAAEETSTLLLPAGWMTPASAPSKSNHLATRAANASDAGAAVAAVGTGTLLVAGRMTPASAPRNHLATSAAAVAPVFFAARASGAALLLGGPMTPASANHLATLTTNAAAPDAVVTIFDVKADTTATSTRAQVPAGGALLLGGRMMPTTAADVGAGGSIFDVVARAAGGIIGLFVAINMKIISRCFGQMLSIILAVVFVVVSNRHTDKKSGARCRRHTVRR